MRNQTRTRPRAEAQAFTDLAKKLLSVPKKEVDEQRAKYEEQREKEKGKRTK